MVVRPAVALCELQCELQSQSSPVVVARIRMWVQIGLTTVTYEQLSKCNRPGPAAIARWWHHVSDEDQSIGQNTTMTHHNGDIAFQERICCAQCQQYYTVLVKRTVLQRCIQSKKQPMVLWYCQLSRTRSSRLGSDVCAQRSRESTLLR